MTRYRGKVPVWHLVHRAGRRASSSASPRRSRSGSTARVIQVARQADPTAQLTIGVDRPWAEWMGSSPFQLGPLHLADYLVRADLGLAGIALEIAPGYSAPGSHLRDLFDFSRLLDLYALLNLPLHIWIVLPSSAAARPAGRSRRPGRVGAMADPARRGDAGRLGREVGRPGGRQAVRPLGHLAAGQRRRAPPSTPTAASSAPTRRPSRSSPGSSRSGARPWPDRSVGIAECSVACTPCVPVACCADDRFEVRWNEAVAAGRSGQ